MVKYFAWLSNDPLSYTKKSVLQKQVKIQKKNYKNEKYGKKGQNRVTQILRQLEQLEQLEQNKSGKWKKKLVFLKV